MIFIYSTSFHSNTGEFDVILCSSDFPIKLGFPLFYIKRVSDPDGDEPDATLKKKPISDPTG